MSAHDLLAAADLEIARAERLLEVAHVAHRLRVSVETVRRWIRRGTLIAIRLDSGHLRIDPCDVTRFLDARRTRHGTTDDNNTHTLA